MLRVSVKRRTFIKLVRQIIKHGGSLLFLDQRSKYYTPFLDVVTTKNVQLATTT